MDEDFKFSLSYEYLTKAAEDEIKKCDLRKVGKEYIRELTRASEIHRFWYLLALHGNLGQPNIERVENDRNRLNELILSKKRACQ